MLRKAISAISVLAVVLAAVAFATTTPSGAGYSTSVEIGKSEKHPAAYAVSVRVTDLGQGQVLAAPKLVVAAGETAEAESQLDDGVSCVVSASVDSGGRSAHYSVRISRGGTLIASHEARVTLP